MPEPVPGGLLLAVDHEIALTEPTTPSGSVLRSLRSFFTLWLAGDLVDC